MTVNPLFFVPFSSGLFFIIVGIMLLKFPPKKINGLYGYRTISSMKSQKRWNFAQIYSAREMIKLGFLLAFIGLIGLKYHPGDKTGTILGLGLLIAMIIILLFRVELAIKNKFKGE